MKKLLALFIAIACFSGIFAQKVDPRYIDGIIYMKLVDDYPLNFRVDIEHDRAVSPDAFPFLKPIFEKYGVNYIGQTLYLFNDPKLLHTLAITFDDIYKVDDFIAELEKFAQIEYAEKPTLKHLMDYTPNDPLYSQSFYGNNFNWHLTKIYAPAAWELQLGSSSVKVAIVDNAIYGGHEDLGIASSNLCTMTGYGSQSVGSADPPTSISSSCSGYNYSNCPGYDWSHGTHCAGLVGAKMNNGVGIASIGGGVTLMGVRTTDNAGNILYDMQGVQWAANNGANVISMSYGAAQSYTTEQQLMQTCYNNGIILVAAAGNEGDQGNEINYPGGYSTVISVASVNGDGKLSYFSQYGNGRADIAAPGGFAGSDGGGSSINTLNVLSTTYNQCSMWTGAYGISSMSGKRYDGMQGTSMATPIVAGLCGLLKSACPNLTPAQAKTALQSTAQSLASGSHQIDGNGYINAYSALVHVQNLSSCGGGTSCGTPTGLSANAGTSSITLSWSAVSGATSYKIFRNGTQIGTSTTTSYTDNTAAAGTTYSYTVKAVCSSGESAASSSVSATIGGGGGGSTSCKYMNDPLSGTKTCYGVEGDGGYLCGSNKYGDQAKANLVSYSGQGTISKMKVQFCGIDGTNGSVSFKIWANSNGLPGSTLGSKTVTLTEIANTVDQQTGEYEVTFTPAISVNGSFFAGIDLSAVNSYIGLASNKNGETNPGIGYEFYDGSWTDMATSWQSQDGSKFNIAMAIFPYVCGTGLGVEDNATDEEFAIFPNPAKDLLNIVLPAGMQNPKLTIFDLSGKAIMSQTLNDTNTTINVGNLSSGIYFVKVGNSTKKFVKE